MELTDKFRTGQYTGKTVAWVQDNDPDYLKWAIRDRPDMIVPNKPVKPTVTELKSGSLQPNLNFYNEGPDPISLPYLRKIAEQKANSGVTKSFFDLDI